MFSETNQNSVAVKGDKERLFVFENNPRLLFLEKKTERFVAALYMVTELLSDREPLKWSLRHRGIELSKAAMSFITAPVSAEDLGRRLVLARLAEVLALLGISHHAGIFSEMNTALLKEECEKMTDLFSRFETQKKVADHGEKRAVFPKDFFIIEGTETVNDKKSEVIANERNFGNTLPPGDRESSRRAFGSRGAIKDILERGIKDTTRGGVLYNVSNDTERRRNILKIFSEKTFVTIKDVSQVVTDCGEKTIQRELISMVFEGILKKTGSRRWTSYSLA